MVEITFSLLRKQYPDLNAETLEQLDVLQLNGLDISCIDNLEIIAHLKELYLSNNKISIIENLDFMYQLQHLDLSNNIITRNSLIANLNSIPTSLVSINLSGNPCSTDDEALLLLQDYLPDLGIIVGLAEEGDINQEENNADIDYSDDEVAPTTGTSIDSPAVSAQDPLTYKPLDADTILRDIVQRKCNPSSQIMEEFDIAHTIEMLNEDCEKTLSSIGKNRRDRGVQSNDRNSSNVGLPASEEAKARVEELLSLSKSNREDAKDFMSRLRETSMKARQKIST